MSNVRCSHCGERVPAARAQLGYRLCLACGEVNARQRKHCSVPLNKGNYVLVTDRTMLTQLNPKRTT